MSRYSVVAGLALLVSGCGALFNSGPAQVMFTSSPNEAEVWINGNRMGVTPVALDLKKNNDYDVTFKKDGYRDSSYTINKQVSAGYVILDVLGGILPVVIDAATGSWYTLSDKTVNMNLAADDTEDAPPLAGRLTPEQLEQVRRGTPAAQFINLAADAMK